MSLNYNLEGIRDYKTVCWIGEGDDVRMNPVTEALIFGTMSVGLGSITDKNVDEFVARFRIIEGIDGAMLYKVVDGERTDWLLSDEDFIAHIGLTTNVSNETRARWANRLFIAKQTSKTESLAGMFHNKRMDIEKAALR